MKNGATQTVGSNWGRIIVLSAIIGLIVGAGFWWWQNSAILNVDSRTVTANVDRPSGGNTKPVVLNNSLPAADRHLESLGDKLAEASFHLREQHHEYAQQALVEANAIAVKTDDNPQLRENLVNGIQQAQTNIAGSKLKEAEQEINLLLNQLNMPEN